jgi:hypothetical protein
MLVERITGGYCVSELANGYLETRRYFGYTKREAIAMFKRDLRLNPNGGVERKEGEE